MAIMLRHTECVTYNPALVVTSQLQRKKIWCINSLYQILTHTSLTKLSLLIC